MADSRLLPTGLPAKRGRILELDALRAMAAINLLLFHFTYVYQNKYGFSAPLGFHWPYGKYGVQLFFMLSGLVNAMTLLSKRRTSDFLAARLIRICPPFWAAMLLNAMLVFFMPLAADPPTTTQWLANLTIVPNLWGQACIEPVTWTLQVELLFYLTLLTWFSLGALNRPLMLTAFVLPLVVAICLPMKAGWLAEGTVVFGLCTALNTSLILDTLPLFLIGVLLNERRCQRGTWLSHGLAILACIVAFHVVDRHAYNPVVTVFFTFLLGLSAFGKIPILRFKPIAYVAGTSYALYLLHNNLGSTAIFHLDGWIGPWPALVLATVLVFVVASISTHRFELPLCNRMRRWWMGPRPSGPAATPHAAPANAVASGR